MRLRITLRTARRIRRWRIEALARGAQLHRCTIHRLERDQTIPEVSTRDRLEALLGLAPGALVFAKGPDYDHRD
jgi:transcriptional regulator with XRE-family HTH domain